MGEFDGVGVKYFQCRYCKKIFSSFEVKYSRMNILKECPYCHGDYKVHAIYEKGFNNVESK